MVQARYFNGDGTNTVNLRTYITDKSLAGDYTIRVTTTLTNPDSSTKTDYEDVKLKVLDPCLTSTIPAQLIPTTS